MLGLWLFLRRRFFPFFTHTHHSHDAVDEQFQLYNKPERKRELVGMLEKQLEDARESSRALEKKAWDIFTVTSATTGFVTALQLSFTDIVAQPGFPFVVGLLLLLYALQVREIWLAIRPVEWDAIPGAANSRFSYESLMEKYVAIGEDDYLNQLIADYAGSNDPEDPSKFVLGAIEKTELKNQMKAKHVRRAGALLGGIVGGLIGISLVAAL